MTTPIGAYEAKTKLSELLRETQKGHSYTITLRGLAVAELIPPTSSSMDSYSAVEELKSWMLEQKSQRVNIKELIEEGRE